MISRLMKNLSKKDTVHLLEIASHAINGNTQTDFDNIALRLQRLIPFSSIIGANVYISKENENTSINSNSRFDGTTFNIPTAFLNVYMEKRLYLIDPVIKESIQKFELIDAQYLFYRNPSLYRNPVHQLALDLKLNYGFTYGVRSSDYMRATGFSFFYEKNNVKVDQRTRIIGQYIVPFMVLLFKKSLRIKQKFTLELLSERELEILRWLKEGKTSWEISMILNIGESTVNFHVTNIMRKLNVTKRTQAVAVAFSQGLLEF